MRESCHEEESGGILKRCEAPKLAFLSLLTSLRALGIVLLQLGSLAIKFKLKKNIKAKQ